MKRIMKKNAIAMCALACVFSGALGFVADVDTVAKAETPINSAFSSFNIQDGAAVRYAKDENDQKGFSYVLEMSAEQYAAVTAEESEFTNVTFGVLIAPEMYYQVHPFNTRENIDTYYSINSKVERKAFLYDVKATSFELAEENGDTVYFRATYADISDENLTLDLRGVGYVGYTYDNVDYEYFYTSDGCVRSMATVAEKEIVKLGDAAENQEKVNGLKAAYINRVNYDLTAEEKTTTRQVYLGNETTFIAPTVSAVSKVQSRNFLKDKYSFEWSLTNETTSVELRDKDDITEYQGKWTLACTATSEKLENGSKVVYSEPVNITSLGVVKTNDTITGGVNSLPYTYDSATGYYKNVENKNAIAYFYDKKTSDDYIVTAKVEVKELMGTKGASVGVALSAGGANQIIIHANSWTSENGLIVSAGDVNSTVFLAAAPNFLRHGALGSTAVGGYVTITIVRQNNTLYVYNGYNQLCFSIGQDGTITNYTLSGKVSIPSADGKDQIFKAALKSFFDAGNENVIGLTYEQSGDNGAKYLYAVDVQTGAAKVQEQLAKMSNQVAASVYLNNASVNSTHTNATYNQANDMYKVTEAKQASVFSPVVANGDYMARLKLDTSDVAAGNKNKYWAGFRIQVASNAYLDIFSGHSDTRSRLYNGLYVKFTTQNASKAFLVDWRSIANLATEAFDSNENNTLDLMLVRKGNSIALYYYTNAAKEVGGTCETLSTWHILFAITFDAQLNSNFKTTLPNVMKDQILYPYYVYNGENLGSHAPNEKGYDSALVSAMQAYMGAGSQTAFAFRQENASATNRYYSIEVNDNDAAVAAFVANGENNTVA